MAPKKSLDEYELIAALLSDIHMSHGVVFNNRSLRLTLEKVRSRLRSEGIGFLTKTLPRLGKAFDKACSGTQVNWSELRFNTLAGSVLPRFLGEFFTRVLDPEGVLLPNPCTQCVGVIRQVCYLFYKYKLPYDDEQQHAVLAKFEKTEQELTAVTESLAAMRVSLFEHIKQNSRVRLSSAPGSVESIRRARILLSKLFCTFDPTDIRPRHGPGAVATRQRLWDKFRWRNVSGSITNVYPFDAYFCASPGHVCDTYRQFSAIGEASLPARVLLVPKDSRGPRLISCEPVDYQWIQQGLGGAIVQHVESHPLTKWNVFFTDQGPNGRGALLGSSTKRYATLDLNEASDRVSLELVRLLFPEHITVYLEACRSSSTCLPDGKEIQLKKYAPMGSCLCFPVLALTVWALLSSIAPDADTSDRILVYGDDVIVPTAFAVNAIEQLEAFGLKVNRDKSCTGGLFRESCGVDAFNGKNVTPVRLRTVWSSLPSPSVYSSWIAYANQFWDRRYFRTYDYIVSRLLYIYKEIPDEDMCLTCPSLRSVPDRGRPKSRRFNRSLQKLEWKVWDLKSKPVKKYMDGWSMLLRYFTEAARTPMPYAGEKREWKSSQLSVDSSPFSASQYTDRRTSMLVRRWR